MANSFSTLMKNLNALWARTFPWVMHKVYWFSLPLIFFLGKSQFPSICHLLPSSLLTRNPWMYHMPAQVSRESNYVLSCCQSTGLTMKPRNPMVDALLDTITGAEPQ